MVELLTFIQHYLPIEAFLPLFFVIVILYYKYIYIPWDKKISKIHYIISKLDVNRCERIDILIENLKELDKKIQEYKNLYTYSSNTQTAEIKKIIEKIDNIESNINDIVARLEKAKDDSKDSKIDLNQQLFSIKQEISDLKTKIEPLLFISRGIK